MTRLAALCPTLLLWQRGSVLSRHPRATTTSRLLVSLFFAWSAYLSGASLTVLPAAARTGNNGLRVTVGSSCSDPQDLVLDTLSLSGTATYQACQTISSSSTEITGPGTVTYRAGQEISLGNGFVVRSGGSFIADINGVLLPGGYVEDRTPNNEQQYAAGFFVRLDSLAIGDPGQLDLFTGHSDNGTAWFWLTLQKNLLLNETRLVVWARQNDGSLVSTENVSGVAIPPGWFWVAIDWKAANEGLSNGYFRLYLNGQLFSDLAGLASSNGLISTVRLGAQNVDSGTAGFLDLDDFRSRRTGPISPPG